MGNSICIYGNPILREEVSPIRKVTNELRAKASRMVQIMHEKEGIGLAAGQIGLTDPIFVLDIPSKADRNRQGRPNNPGINMPKVFINPEIIGRSKETSTAEEGCLSFPKMYVSVTRPAEVVLRYLDLNGNEQMLQTKGLLARAIQHEVDHLNGILLIDYMSFSAKLKHALLLRKFRKQNMRVKRLAIGKGNP